jgi:large subunit ribosomal protein L9
MKQAERIKTDADARRAVLNKEMSVIAERLQGVTLTFPARASETGRLYGSVNTRMIADAVSEEAGIEISHRQVESQPLRMIGEHSVELRLTVDLIPQLRAIVYREGETPALALEEEAAREAEAEAEAVPGEPGEAPEAIEVTAPAGEYAVEAVPAEAVEVGAAESDADAQVEAEAETAQEPKAEVSDETPPEAGAAESDADELVEAEAETAQEPEAEVSDETPPEAAEQ